MRDNLKWEGPLGVRHVFNNPSIECVTCGLREEKVGTYENYMAAFPTWESIDEGHVCLRCYHNLMPKIEKDDFAYLQRLFFHVHSEVEED